MLAVFELSIMREYKCLGEVDVERKIYLLITYNQFYFVHTDGCLGLENIFYAP